MQLDEVVVTESAEMEERGMRPIRVGIFGCMRGSNFPKIVLMNNGEVVALCDRSLRKLEQTAKDLPEKPTLYTDFDAFLEHDMDAVILANYFHEHAPYAIRCLEKGLHVLSECTSNGTMAEGVALVRAVEKSKAVYMLGENYPYLKFNQEMERVYRSGNLGKALYAEGEYNHPYDPNDLEFYCRLSPRTTHWRHYLPCTYYLTHSLAPLMHITGARPIRVTAMPIWHPDSQPFSGSYVGDSSAIITCLNDDASVFRVTGRAAFGAKHQSFRICGTRGQIENTRGGGGKVMLRYNEWDVPEGADVEQHYKPEWPADCRAMMERSGNGAEFFVIREFFRCIRQKKQPIMDVYFATTMASVGILGHRSLLEKGVPYDIPDFRKEADRQQYENDRLTPFWGPDGSPPTIPCCSDPDFRPTEEQLNAYRILTGEAEVSRHE